MGDFNANIGVGEAGETCTGHLGYGARNNREESLVNFNEQHHLKIMNTFFKKSRYGGHKK